MLALLACVRSMDERASCVHIFWFASLTLPRRLAAGWLAVAVSLLCNASSVDSPLWSCSSCPCAPCRGWCERCRSDRRMQCTSPVSSHTHTHTERERDRHRGLASGACKSPAPARTSRPCPRRRASSPTAARFSFSSLFSPCALDRPVRLRPPPASLRGPGAKIPPGRPDGRWPRAHLLASPCGATRRPRVTAGPRARRARVQRVCDQAAACRGWRQPAHLPRMRHRRRQREEAA